jgi:hypothetical protein
MLCMFQSHRPNNVRSLNEHPNSKYRVYNIDTNRLFPATIIQSNRIIGWLFPPPRPPLVRVFVQLCPFSDINRVLSGRKNNGYSNLQGF